MMAASTGRYPDEGIIADLVCYFEGNPKYGSFGSEDGDAWRRSPTGGIVLE